MKYLLLILLIPTFALAEKLPKTAELIDTVLDAKSIKKAHPKFPIDAARKGQEGSVIVSFVIDKSGNVVDPIVEDSTGVKSLEKSAIRAVKNWKYDPATRNGEPIEQCQMKVQLDYRLEGARGVRHKFARSYKEITTAIQEEDYVLAEEEIAKLRKSKIWNMTENAWFWLADALLANATGDKARELDSTRKSVSGRKDALGNENYLYLLQQLFVLEVEDTMYASALHTYENIAKAKNSQSLVEHLKPYADKIRTSINSEKALTRKAKISERGHMQHVLSRNTFYLTNIEGVLDELEVRCANKRSRFTIAKDNRWQTPASWGKCTVFVKGEKHAKFNLVELADNT